MTGTGSNFTLLLLKEQEVTLPCCYLDRKLLYPATHNLWKGSIQNKSRSRGGSPLQLRNLEAEHLPFVVQRFGGGLVHHAQDRLAALTGQLHHQADRTRQEAQLGWWDVYCVAYIKQFSGRCCLALSPAPPVSWLVDALLCRNQHVVRHACKESSLNLTKQ